MAPEEPQAVARESRAAVAGLLWSATLPGRRGPKPKFTLEQIADAGIAIADRDGLDAVTMQRVADHLGAAKMALYRYVPGRLELEAVMFDRALGAPPPVSDDDWRTALLRWALDLHARASERPWAVELVQRPHVPGPQELAWFEAGLRALRDLALTGGERLDVLALLVGHIMGIVRQQTAGAASETEMAEALGPILAARARDYPLTAAAFADPGAGKRDDALKFGIERVLAGVEALANPRTHT